MARNIWTGGAIWCMQIRNHEVGIESTEYRPSSRDIMFRFLNEENKMQLVLGCAFGGGIGGALIGLLMIGFSKYVFLFFLLGFLIGANGGIKRNERIKDQKKAIMDAHEEIMKK